MLDPNIDLLNSLSDLTSAELFSFLFFATFLSEDAACLLAGTSVATGRASFGLAVSACLAGIFVGDLLLFWIGRVVGTTVFETRFARKFISQNNAEGARQWLARNAATAVFVSRFISGLRLPTYLAAGALRNDPLRFATYFLLAAAVWTPLLVGTVAFSVSQIYPRNIFIGLIVFAIVLKFAIKLSNWKYRRLVLGQIRRTINWEFWPLAVFYFPVVCYVVYRGVRYRSLTLFTAANPGIPAGGFVGESKDEIYRSLERSAASRAHCLQYEKIKGADNLTKRLAVAVLFIVKNELSYPLVLKPDRGERGKGVVIVRDRRQLARSIASAKQDMILQEYFDGVEASIFYYRFPTNDRGRILSITEKIFPSVVGDGSSTLEELILRDDRAVSMSRSYFKQHGGNLNSCPANGEVVKLIDIGTHSRGAIFRDGSWIKTPELESKIDDICRGISGFYFGRFDIRARSFEDLKKGLDFKIIELNGVTSESTNIYDPRYSLIDAYKILFKQWRLAFEIGKVNRDRGHAPVTLRQFVKLIYTKNVIHIGELNSDKLSSINPTKACA